jgi:hypothetical protein
LPKDASLRAPGRAFLGENHAAEFQLVGHSPHADANVLDEKREPEGDGLPYFAKNR